MADVVGAGSALAAAVAAVASWRSVVVAQRDQERARTPELRAQLVKRPGVEAPELNLHIVNVGGGPALSVGFVVVVGSEVYVGFLADPVLHGGARAAMVMPFECADPGRATGVVSCIDPGGGVRATDLRSNTRVLKYDPADRDLWNVYAEFYAAPEDPTYLSWDAVPADEVT